MPSELGCDGTLRENGAVTTIGSGAFALLAASMVGCGGTDHAEIAHAKATVPFLDTGAANVTLGSPPAMPATTKPTPIVLADRHAPLGGIWLPNGHLLMATTAELIDIDPEHPDDAWRVIPVERDLFALAGARDGQALENFGEVERGILLAFAAGHDVKGAERFDARFKRRDIRAGEGFEPD